MPGPVPSSNPAPARQAVVLVHGMGEQIPMDTIKGFVGAVWETDGETTANGLPRPAQVWSKPDERTGSLELRRITTRQSVASGAFPNGVRTDFYELYWADLTAGSTWAQFTTWVRYLLFRPWSRVPKAVRSAWILLWVLALLVTALGLVSVVPDKWWTANMPSWLWRSAVVAAAAAALALLHRMATATFGRVVRYTRADPANIAARAAVRARGLQLLRALHDADGYQRVVLVGHSLGSILAYDLLSYFWSEQSGARRVREGTPAFEAIREIERRAAALDAADTPDNQCAFRIAQTQLRRALQIDKKGSTRSVDRWLISDFVTLGSPLTHAEFLLASSKDDLDARQRARELPTSPPYREELDPEVVERARSAGLPLDDDPARSRLMVFPDPKAPDGWILHHASPFAAVRWTNVHDPASLVFRGDVIGGPVSAPFGRGVLDIDLAARDRPSKRFSHTRYWAKDQPPKRMSALREAVNLLDRDPA